MKNKKTKRHVSDLEVEHALCSVGRVSVATKIRVIPARSSGSSDQVFDGAVRGGYGREEGRGVELDLHPANRPLKRDGHSHLI